MSGYVLKPASRDVTFTIDWSRGYLGPGERVMRDLGWSVQSDEAARSLAVIAQDQDARRSWAAFRGGAPGRAYLVTSRVKTTHDRVLSRAIVMRIALG